MKLFLIISGIIFIFGTIIYFQHSVNKIDEKLERINRK